MHHILYSNLYRGPIRKTTNSKAALKKKRKASHEKNRLRRKASANSPRYSMCSSIQDVMELYADSPPHISLFGFRNPLVPKQPFQKRIPSDVYETLYPITDTTPNERIGTIADTDHCAVKRRLFISPNSPKPPNSIASGNLYSENMKAWLEKCSEQHPLYSEDDDTTDTDIPEEEQYGFPLPTWLSSDGDEGPKLVKEKRVAKGCPVSKHKKMMVSRVNHDVIKQWLRDCSIKQAVGEGHVELDKQAIQPSTCQFSDAAEGVIKQMSPVMRYPLKRYIAELKKKEQEAITTARVYRDKWEDAIQKREEDVAEAKRKELSIHTYWRKNIAEQCTRGGKMVNLALHKKLSDI